MEYNHTYIITDKEALILRTLIQNADICAKELAIILHMSFSALSNRLAILESHQIIYRVKQGRNTYIYINEKFKKEHPIYSLEDDQQFFQKLKEEKEKDRQQALEKINPKDYDYTYKTTDIEDLILRVIFQNPDKCVKELATILHMSFSALSNKLAILESYQIIYRIKQGRNTYIYINEKFKKEHPIYLLEDDQQFFQKLNEEKAKDRQQALEKINQVDYDYTYKTTDKEALILRTLIQNPDKCLKELATILHMSYSTLSNKLTILESHQIIYRIKQGRNTYIYINEKFKKEHPIYLLEDDQQFFQMLNEEKAKDRQQALEKINRVDYDYTYKITDVDDLILRTLIQNPDICAKELAAILHMSYSALSNKLAILESHQIICRIKQGRNTYIYINEKFKKDYSHFLIKEKITVTDKLLISLVKNILCYSSSIHAKRLIENFDFFLSFFSIIEMIQLLYLLNICDLMDQSFFLFETDENPVLTIKEKKELLTRYHDICYYINTKYKNRGVCRKMVEKNIYNSF